MLDSVLIWKSLCCEMGGDPRTTTSQTFNSLITQRSYELPDIQKIWGDITHKSASSVAKVVKNRPL